MRWVEKRRRLFHGPDGKINQGRSGRRGENRDGDNDMGGTDGHILG